MFLLHSPDCFIGADCDVRVHKRAVRSAGWSEREAREVWILFLMVRMMGVVMCGTPRYGIYILYLTACFGVLGRNFVRSVVAIGKAGLVWASSAEVDCVVGICCGWQLEGVA